MRVRAMPDLAVQFKDDEQTKVASVTVGEHTLTPHEWAVLGHAWELRFEMEGSGEVILWPDKYREVVTVYPTKEKPIEK